MTRVSRRPLRKNLEERMFQIFWECFASLRSTSEAFSFLEDLLSQSEKIMLAKRLAIAVLLEKGWRFDQISNALKVSTSTVNTINSKMLYRGDGYRKMISKVMSHEELRKSLEQIAVEIASIALPYNRGTIKRTAGKHFFEQKIKKDIL